MGVTKKATVVAKKTTKKRGRPAGSKNKSKDPEFPINSKGWVPPTVDWEKLAKQLQEALSAQMKENEALEQVVVDFKAAIRVDSSFTFWDRLVFLFSGKL